MSKAERPARTTITVTKSDSTVYDPPLKALYIGGTGAIAVETMNNYNGAGDGGPTTFAAHPVGYVRVGEIRRVMSTNTTATDIVGLIR